MTSKSIFRPKWRNARTREWLPWCLQQRILIGRIIDRQNDFLRVTKKECTMKAKRSLSILLLIVTVIFLQPEKSPAQESLPAYLGDRGTGMPTSQFGTYVRKGEILIYPFHEYYYDHNVEYEPYDFGHGSTREYRGRYEANEGLIFICYGVSDRLALEFEAGIIGAEFNKSEKDFSTVPQEIEKFGLSDVEGQIRWRWNFEKARTPEFFNYFEYVLPTGEKNSLIGTSAWEFKLGTGMVKGFQ